MYYFILLFGLNPGTIQFLDESTRLPDERISFNR